MSSDALDERRSYAAPMQVSETPSRHGTSVIQRADMVCISIPRSKSQTQDVIGTTPGRTSLSGRMRSASTNIKDVIGSYQQSQTQFYGSFLDSPPNISYIPRRQSDEEAVISEDGDSTYEGSRFDQEDYDVNEDQESNERAYASDTQNGLIYHSSLLRGDALGSGERRPLLATKIPSYSGKATDLDLECTRKGILDDTESSGVRPFSIAGHRKSISKPPRGSSSYTQTLFNAIGILLGVGMLSEPLAFAYAGWIGGFLLIAFYGFLTCYTAKILAHIILSDGRLRTYADIGQKAFGRRTNPFTTFLFCLELFSFSAALVVLFSDSMHAVAPHFSSHEYKLLGLVILLPSIFLPLHLLSFASLLGILATIFIIVVILVDGFSKAHAPGSLWEAAPTDLMPDWASLPVAFGLFMAGFAGHAVIPSLARDMAEPEYFDSMINWAFFISTIIYAIVGAGGYIMFGRGVSDEVSVDLMKIPEYNQALNKAAVWMLVVSPLTKFALCTRPLNITIEIMLGIDQASSSAYQAECPPSPCQKKQSQLDPCPFVSHRDHEQRLQVFRAMERIGLALAIVAVAILFPEFGTVMAFLGAFSAFMLCVIGPICAKAALTRRLGTLDLVLLVISAGMAGAGTRVAFRTRGGT